MTHSLQGFQPQEHHGKAAALSLRNLYAQQKTELKQTTAQNKAMRSAKAAIKQKEIEEKRRIANLKQAERREARGNPPPAGTSRVSATITPGVVTEPLSRWVLAQWPPLRPSHPTRPIPQRRLLRKNARQKTHLKHCLRMSTVSRPAATHLIRPPSDDLVRAGIYVCVLRNDCIFASASVNSQALPQVWCLMRPVAGSVKSHLL